MCYRYHIEDASTGSARLNSRLNKKSEDESDGDAFKRKAAGEPKRWVSRARSATVTHPTSVIRGLRWWIVALIFLVTCINYVDRSSIGLLVTHFGPEIGITSREYGLIGALLLLAYTLSQSISGRLYDRYGARWGFSVSIIVWCIAAMAHSAIVGFTSFAACSFFLGLGEAGNWPGAAKVIAEWFPQKERALAMAIFNGGASMGGVIAPLLVAGFLDPLLGWRLTFLIVGVPGFLWLIAWLRIYRPLMEHPRVSAEEREYILEGRPALGIRAAASPLRSLLALRQTWGILLARFLVDPIWWLYILWLPTYLKEVRHFSLKDIGASAWVPYLAAAVGSLFGGWLAGKLIARGVSVNIARKSVTGCAACLMTLGVLAARAQSAWGALLFISIVLFGFQMWISNVQTLPSDFFLSADVGSVAGLGGTAAGVSSLIFNLCTGALIAHYGYGAVLTIAGVLAPVGAVILFLVAGEVRRLDTKMQVLSTTT
jgi:ACS family hexuronate transporter-like MFS transporter